MNTNIHAYAARIERQLWEDILYLKDIEGRTESVNSMLNQALRMLRDKRIQEIRKERDERRSIRLLY